MESTTEIMPTRWPNLNLAGKEQSPTVTPNECRVLCRMGASYDRPLVKVHDLQRTKSNSQNSLKRWEWEPGDIVAEK